MNMRTINAGHVKPVGYSAKYITMKETACAKHQYYWPLCSKCIYREEHKTITLGEGILAIVICRESGEALEWITADTPWETAQNIATWGELVISQDVWEMEEKPLSIIRAMHEATLYADCFGLEAPKFGTNQEVTE